MLERLHERLPFSLQECDIESDDALHAAYLERIPVISIDGRECFELVIDEQELERALIDR